jgi:hypothetical protein
MKDKAAEELAQFVTVVPLVVLTVSISPYQPMYAISVRDWHPRHWVSLKSWNTKIVETCRDIASSASC